MNGGVRRTADATGTQIPGRTVAAPVGAGMHSDLRRTGFPITGWPQLVEKWLETIGMIS